MLLFYHTKNWDQVQRIRLFYNSFYISDCFIITVRFLFSSLRSEYISTVSFWFNKFLFFPFYYILIKETFHVYISTKIISTVQWSKQIFIHQNQVSISSWMLFYFIDILWRKEITIECAYIHWMSKILLKINLKLTFSLILKFLYKQNLSVFFLYIQLAKWNSIFYFSGMKN